MAREIALLTNPTSGKGRGGQARAAVLDRLRRGGLVVRDLSGRDADESLDLARAALQDGAEALVVLGGDGMVHLGVQAVAGTGTPLGIVPAGTGNDVARYFDLPRKDPSRPRTSWSEGTPAWWTWPAAAAATTPPCCARASTPWSTSGPTR
ncbi:diacylglycerol/lipid kinase family protein [Nocardioides anomalus]|uniref:diacylglycerol/lipid kinase family protein n=1 Tax=Nocardioides anomalus TaxID=2712223 RepID=UPI002E7868E3|nr:diacylglycerol kinase family protein [Nocardioides anomalus]